MEKRDRRLGEPASLQLLVKELKVGEWATSSSDAAELNVTDSVLQVEKWLCRTDIVRTFKGSSSFCCCSGSSVRSVLNVSLLGVNKGAGKR